MKHTFLTWFYRYAFSVLLLLLTLGIVLGSMPSVVENARAERLNMAEETLRRAVVSCYALEGRYPPDIAYLRQHYGVQISETDYIVHYEIFAENIMPEITVLER